MEGVYSLNSKRLLAIDLDIFNIWQGPTPIRGDLEIMISERLACAGTNYNYHDAKQARSQGGFSRC